MSTRKVVLVPAPNLTKVYPNIFISIEKSRKLRGGKTNEKGRDGSTEENLKVKLKPIHRNTEKIKPQVKIDLTLYVSLRRLRLFQTLKHKMTDSRTQNHF